MDVENMLQDMIDSSISPVIRFTRIFQMECEIFMRERAVVTVPKTVCAEEVFVFQANDRVIQIKNNCDKEVFNGDIGVIESVNAEKRTLKVNFDDCIIECDVTVMKRNSLLRESFGSES